MTMLRLQPGIVYGPVRSRRLGRSLGINLLPPSAKLCSFDCIYCQYGRTGGRTMWSDGAPLCPAFDDVWATFPVNAASPTGSTFAGPAAGHWEVRVDSSSGVTGGNDVNGYGVSAHDGTPGAGGTELNVYVDSFIPPDLEAGVDALYPNAFREVERFLNRPRVKRAYYGALKELIDGPFSPEFLSPYLDRLDAAGFATTEIGRPGGFIDRRRSLLATAVAGVTSPRVRFSITTNNGNPVETVGEGFAVDVLEDEVALAVLLFDAVDAGDVGMAELGEGPRFALEAGESLGVAREVLGERLDGDGAAESGVGGEEDDAHAAASDLAVDGVRPHL